MKRDLSRRVLLFHTMAFIALAGLIWANEVFDLPHAILGAPAAGAGLRYQEAAMESGVALLVGLVVIVVEARFARRIEYLESLLVMCAWCGRVKIEKGEWVSVERFLKNHQVDTSHGMCPECALGMISEHD